MFAPPTRTLSKSTHFKLLMFHTSKCACALFVIITVLVREGCSGHIGHVCFSLNAEILRGLRDTSCTIATLQCLFLGILSNQINAGDTHTLAILSYWKPILLCTSEMVLYKLSWVNWKSVSDWANYCSYVLAVKQQKFSALAFCLKGRPLCTHGQFASIWTDVMRI